MYDACCASQIDSYSVDIKSNFNSGRKANISLQITSDKFDLMWNHCSHKLIKLKPSVMYLLIKKYQSPYTFN